MGIVIKLRRDSSTNWSNINPVLHEGEAGYELNTGKLKIGDGNTLWNDLPYFAGGESLSTEQIQDIFGSSFLVAGSGINLDYNDENDTLTISSSGVAFTIPTGNIDLHNGGVQEAQLLQFDDNTKQSVITGPTPDENTNAQRLIIQGQKGQGTGEGGDVYFWAGDADTNGGDIKIYAGDADNASSGYGGYVNIDGGKGATTGGNVEITAGYSEGGTAGDVNIIGGPTNSGVAGDVNIKTNNNTYIWTFESIDGDLKIPGNITLPNNTTVATGTFDNGTGGGNGISLNCVVGYELNWQGGHLKSTLNNGATTYNILFDSAIEFPGSGVDNMEINPSGLVFPDGTTQTSAPLSIEDIQDNIANSFLVSGSGLSVSYNDNANTITISATSAPKITTTVFNKTGSPIPKFSVVYIDGGQGDQPTVALAIADGETGSSRTYGITNENISNMSAGSVIIIGALTGINTDQFNPTAPSGNVNGTTLWLSPTVAGGVTTTKPTAPNHAVSVGTIVRTHQNEGVVEVRIQNGYEIDELHNVKVSGVLDNDVLVYNSTNKLWENKNNVVFSDNTGITGATTVNNIVKISQANYNNLSSIDPNTVYIIT